MQSRYGIPAAVTIAQAIDESGWGQSALAIRDHNLFGIKGTGPAGTDMLPTQEYQNGQYVTVNAPFRVYHNVAQSIADHGHLLATSSSYQHAMADRHLPDAFATDLTGVYATDPHYGSNLIAIMKLYNLYRYSAPDAQQAAPRPPASAAPQAAAQPRRRTGRAEWTAGRDGEYQRHGQPGRHVRPGRRGQPERAGQPGRARRPGQGRPARAARPVKVGRPARVGRPASAGSASPGGSAARAGGQPRQRLGAGRGDDSRHP